MQTDIQAVENTLDVHADYYFQYTIGEPKLSGYFASGRRAKYCDQRVCMSVCLSVHLSISKKHTFKFHQIFCTCYLWPWLGLPLTVLQYVLYFRFGG